MKIKEVSVNGMLSIIDSISYMRKSGKKRQKQRHYKNCICAFDIETTRIREIEQSVTWLWQFALLDISTQEIYFCVGRDIQSAGKFFRDIHSGCILCVYVHNLAYEFQFLSGVLNWYQVFAVKTRTPLKACAGAIEFRCSYLLTHKSLAKFLSDMNVEHKKLYMDYDEIRYPWSKVSQKDIWYGVHDVVGLCEAIYELMTTRGDNLYTIPLTSTGYIRREAKQAVRKYRKTLASLSPTPDQYKLLRLCFRGGDTHANRFKAGKIIEDVKSADRSSSYPDVMLNDKYPMSEFEYCGAVTKEDLNRYEHFGKCYMGVFKFYGIHLTDPYHPNPYLTKDKAIAISRGEGGEGVLHAFFDNGRFLTVANISEDSEDFYEVALTDVDFKIVSDEYTWTRLEIYDCYTAKYDYLPSDFRDLINRLYYDKTSLKGVEGAEQEYMLSKEKINSAYGMCAQNPVKPDIDFIDGLWTVRDVNMQEVLDNAKKKAFLPYQWGVWVTAHARYWLKQAAKIVGDDFVYCDTDSVKYEGKHDFTALNKLLQERSEQSGAYADDPRGRRHYMGVYEDDGHYNKFITYGAKKYAYVENSKLRITIAGVLKKEGAEELEKSGGLESLKLGYIFREGGGLESVYNDEDFGDYEIEGRHIYISRNVVLRPSTYTLGLAADYETLLNNPLYFREFILDNSYKNEYTR